MYKLFLFLALSLSASAFAQKSVGAYVMNPKCECLLPSSYYTKEYVDMSSITEIQTNEVHWFRATMYFDDFIGTDYAHLKIVKYTTFYAAAKNSINNIEELKQKLRKRVLRNGIDIELSRRELGHNTIPDYINSSETDSDLRWFIEEVTGEEDVSQSLVQQL